jgi:hypothetical protein
MRPFEFCVLGLSELACFSAQTLRCPQLGRASPSRMVLARHSRQRIWALSALAVLRLRQLHHVRASKQPVQAHVEAICDLANAMKIEGAQADGVEIESAPAAHADAAENGLVCQATNAAGFGEQVRLHASYQTPLLSTSLCERRRAGAMPWRGLLLRRFPTITRNEKRDSSCCPRMGKFVECSCSAILHERLTKWRGAVVFQSSDQFRGAACIQFSVCAAHKNRKEGDLPGGSAFRPKQPLAAYSVALVAPVRVLSEATHPADQGDQDNELRGTRAW